MSRIEMRWPDQGGEEVRATRERLVLSGAALRAMSLEERLEIVARVLGDWTTADSPWRRELARSLASATPFSEATISEGLDSALRAWHPDRLIACARTELAAAFGRGARDLVPFEWTAVIAGGAIPMPTILSALLPLALGSPVLLRETSKDPVTAGLLSRSLEARDERFARGFEHLRFPSTDALAIAETLAAPCVVATGSDETIASIAQRLEPRQRFVGYGHRFSIAVLGAEIALNAARLREAAEGIALDVARWDQSGCLSPVVVYLVGVDANLSEQIAREISQALATLASTMPRGELSPEVLGAIATERAEARMRSASGRGLLFEGSDYTLTLESDARPRPAPLHRFLRLMPVESNEALLVALAPFSGHLSSVAIEGIPERDVPENAEAAVGELNCAQLINALSQLGVSRFTQMGRLQIPPVDWPHDGMPLFTPIARFASSDTKLRYDGHIEYCD